MRETLWKVGRTEESVLFLVASSR